MDEELLNDIRRTGSHFAKLSRFQRGHTPVKGEQAFRFYLSRHKKYSPVTLQNFSVLEPGEWLTLQSHWRKKEGLSGKRIKTMD